MRYSEWYPLYMKILKEMDIDEKRDKRSRNLLNKKIEPLNKRNLKKSVRKKCVVYGDSPNLTDELKKTENSSKTKIVADSAIEKILNNNIIPEILLTDLDGDIEFIKEAQEKGSILVVHSHGDNMDKIERYIETLNPVIGTTQTRPMNKIYNFGGFTDGDRSVFLAEEFGAKEIELVGFDFKLACGEKLKKLGIAEKLISYLKNNREVIIDYRHL